MRLLQCQTVLTDSKERPKWAECSDSWMELATAADQVVNVPRCEHGCMEDGLASKSTSEIASLLCDGVQW